MNRLTISFIGAGRVGSALATGWFNAGFKIREIVTRSDSNQALARRCNAIPKSEPVFDGETDLVVVAVPDDEIKNVAERISCGDDTVVAHTAGSTGLEVFPPRLKHKGIIYPLQTFTVGREVDLGQVPFFIEASGENALVKIQAAAGAIGGLVIKADPLQRMILHTAAVFVSNFTNHMLTSGKTVAERGGFDFGLLRPLIEETVKKALENGPEDSQTGPALRGDKGTLEKHIELLSFSPDLQELYREISGSIINFHKIRKDDKL